MTRLEDGATADGGMDEACTSCGGRGVERRLMWRVFVHVSVEDRETGSRAGPCLDCLGTGQAEAA